jgi:hypothetical protein
MKQKYMVMGPARPGTKYDCAGEGQQQLARPEQEPLSTVVLKRLSMIGVSYRAMSEERANWENY